MAALFDLFRKDTPKVYEPSPRLCHYASSVEGSVYVYSGRTQRYSKEKDSLQSQVEVYHPMTEGWTQKKTQGDLPPPGLYYGACTSTRDGMCTFGGDDGKEYYGDLYHLALSTMTWRRVCSISRRSACGMVTFRNNKVAVIGGYSHPPSDLQPGATFTRDSRFTDGSGWNNEFHTFDLDTGVLSSPPVTGSRSPPCSHFSFTSVDDHRAVIFGGLQPGRGQVKDLYVIDFDSMHWTKIEQGVGEPWPVARSSHAACCLGYGGDHPHLLVSGGLDKDGKTLDDIWLFDLSSRKWKKLTLPDDTLQTTRFSHSTTAIPLTAGLIEVVMFGGCPQRPASAKNDDDFPKISETTILRFEFKDTPSADGGLSTMEWVVVDVATNNHRGTSDRLQQKMTKIVTKTKELASKGESVPSPDHTPTEVTELRETIRVLQEEKRVLEERMGEGERRAELAEARAVETEERGNTLVREELLSKGESVPSPDHTPSEVTELRETIRVLREERVGEGERRAETERTEANDRPDTDSRELKELAEVERSPETAHLLEQQANERAQSPAAETKGDTQEGIDQQHTQEATGVNDPSSNTKPPPESLSRTIRIDRKFNLVIYGIPEDPTGLSRLKRHQNDLRQATDVIRSIDDSIPSQSIRDCYRLGKYRDHAQPRPLCVIMTEKSHVNSILSKGDKLLSRPYSVKPDMSPEDLAANKLLLKERWSLMESDVHKKDIKIVRSSLYVRHQLHARVRGSQLVRPSQEQQQHKHGDSSSTPSQSGKDSSR